MSATELFTYLLSEQNQYGLDPISAHGFLCATVVGKPNNQWLRDFFEGQDDTVPTSIKNALSAWRDELITIFKNEQSPELPLEELDDMDFATLISEESAIVAWCTGFVDGMYANENTDWFDNEDTEEDIADLTLPMVVLSGVMDEDEDIIALKNSEEIVLDLINSIESNLLELFLLFHTQD